MAAELADAMGSLRLAAEAAPQSAEPASVVFKVAGCEAFTLELETSTAVRDVKKLVAEESTIAPEHMRLLYKGKQLKDALSLDDEGFDGEGTVQVLYTAGHTGLVGGSQKQEVVRNPFNPPVRGIPGSKGSRTSRMSGRPGGMGLIRKYGIMMKRQEFREKATEIGFIKYR
ncbi:unnamed protein product [Prorocentrum cordatum]|uniref:Ubiquitin-like domain-containing protein n=1 Tax=Prorocentrum cordatum TaxID=2364126 RepID=A0ABN9VGQ4_9DINO|nr:unnamed protein product [Polarella glacialis]